MTRRPSFLPLSRQDEGYLRRESADQPMHFTIFLRAAADVDGRPLTVDEVRRHVSERLDRVPHLTWRVARAPGGVGPAVWVAAPVVDVAAHVTPLVATGATAYARPTVLPLDLTRPLWHIGVAPPDADGDVLVALSIHHAAMDGGLLAT